MASPAFTPCHVYGEEPLETGPILSKNPSGLCGACHGAGRFPPSECP